MFSQKHLDIVQMYNDIKPVAYEFKFVDILNYFNVDYNI